MQCGAKVKKIAAMPNEISPPEMGTVKTGLQSSPTPQTKMSWPSLILGLGIMLAISIYPIAFANKLGKVNHASLMVLMWSMMAGIIRGVGFIPRNKILKFLFSTITAFITLIVAIATNFFI